MFIRWLAAFTLAATVFFGGASLARAHCDRLDGPVVTDARAALASGRVGRVLKWVRGSDEPQVREAFAKTMRVRAAGGEARELADRYFFETVVRLHRAAEGEPFTGLKPAGADPGPAVRATDAALAKRSADELVEQTTGVVARGIRIRFARVLAAKKRASRSVVDGRRYVAAYVDLLHYVEHLDTLARARAPHLRATKHETHVMRSKRARARTAKR
jgi:hypothetical protein